MGTKNDAERVARDYGGARRGLARRVASRGSLKGVTAGELTRQARAALISFGLGQAAEETNSAELLDKAFRVTRMGEGGLPSSRAIPLESRAVQPSYLGFIDPVRTPESMNAGVDMSLAGSVRRGPDGQAYVRFTDAKTGEGRWVTPQQAVSMTIAMPGQNTDRPTAQVMSGGRLRRVPWDRVDVIAPDPEEGFGPLSNMVPMKSTTKGQRVSMAARMIAQALPLTNAESPLVQTAVPGHDGLSYERKYGGMLGAVEADTAGYTDAVQATELLGGLLTRTPTIQTRNAFLSTASPGIHLAGDAREHPAEVPRAWG